MNSIKNDNVWYFRATDTIGNDDASGDSISLNVDQITGFAPASRTSLEIWFKKSPQTPTPGTETQNGKITISITTDKNKEVMQALSEAASSRNNTFRTIGDDVTFEYLHHNITGVTTIHQT